MCVLFWELSRREESSAPGRAPPTDVLTVARVRKRNKSRAVANHVLLGLAPT